MTTTTIPAINTIILVVNRYDREGIIVRVRERKARSFRVGGAVLHNPGGWFRANGSAQALSLEVPWLRLVARRCLIQPGITIRNLPTPKLLKIRHARPRLPLACESRAALTDEEIKRRAAIPPDWWSQSREAWARYRELVSAHIDAHAFATPKTRHLLKGQAVAEVDNATY